MSKEILVIIWLGIMAILSMQEKCKRFEYQNGKNVIRSAPWFAITVFLPLILWAGFRAGAGYGDTNAYIALYNDMPLDIQEFKVYLDTIKKDTGFYIFVWLIKRMFGNPYRFFLLTVAVIQGISMIKFYRRYSENYILSVVIFVLAGEYLGWMMNGIRQFLAVSIIYFAIPWIIDKKYVRSIVIILLASMFHQTALIMIPIIFIVQGKPWNAKTLLMIGVALLSLFATTQFTNFMSDAMEGTSYAANIVEMADQEGTNPLRVIVYSIPALLSLAGKKNIENENDKIINISVNMSIITMVLSVIGMMTSGIMIGRLPIYTGLFNYCLLPYEINHLFEEKTKRMLNILMIMMYSSFYYYLMHFAYGRI